jgi:hypothetical protein
VIRNSQQLLFCRAWILSRKVIVHLTMQESAGNCSLSFSGSMISFWLGVLAPGLNAVAIWRMGAEYTVLGIDFLIISTCWLARYFRWHGRVINSWRFVWMHAFFPEIMLQPVRSAYPPPATSTFLSEQTSHQQPASSTTLLSEQTSNSHQPPAKWTGSVEMCSAHSDGHYFIL